jgi:hypothetical protein
MSAFQVSPAYIILTQKGWQAGSGLITALLVTFMLTPDEQGYYYTFASLISGYVLFDLGLSTLLVQISARLFSGLKLNCNQVIEPDGESKGNYLRFISWSLRWFRYVALFVLVLLPIGYLYFSTAESSVDIVHWEFPWLVTVVAVSLSMFAYPALAVIEGIGRVSEVYLIRLIYYIIGGVGAWLLLAMGFGLYAIAAAPISVAIVVFYWKYSRYKSFTLETSRVIGRFDWIEHVWPLQSKVIFTWFASYILLYSPTLLVFYIYDASIAGRLGLSIVIANLISSMASSWFTAKVPNITSLMVSGKIKESRRLFVVEFRRAFLLALVAYFLVFVAAIYLDGTVVLERVLKPYDLFLLFCLFLVYFAMNMFVVYFRAQGREVLALVAFISSIISSVVSVFYVDAYGATGVLLIYLIVYGSFNTSGMLYLWKRNVN